MKATRLSGGAAAALLVVGLIWAAGELQDGQGSSPGASARPAASQAPSEPDEAASAPSSDLTMLLDQVDVVDERPDVAGYDRECGTGHACSFGQRWSDDVDVHLGHNGCGTRDDVLARDLEDVTYRPGTDDCVVETGTLHDPYTGQTIAFTKTEAHEVGVDHLYPLARAWDLGAAEWPQQRRTDFANDPRNLLAVSGPANSSKGDRGPGEWMPINAAHRCDYIAGYLEVAIAYDLPVTAADHDAAVSTSTTC